MQHITTKETAFYKLVFIALKQSWRVRLPELRRQKNQWSILQLTTDH
jgi:hypothetical protein